MAQRITAESTGSEFDGVRHRIECHAEWMNPWGVELYGDPCRECGYHWTTDVEELLRRVSQLPSELEQLLAGANGTERLDQLEWNVSAYVSHVADNLRIWAERLVSVARGAAPNVRAFDENAMAQVRHYNDIALSLALWSLQFSTQMWLQAISEARETNVTLLHSSRGEMSVEDVIRANVHDAVHHHWDIASALRA